MVFCLEAKKRAMIHLCASDQGRQDPHEYGYISEDTCTDTSSTERLDEVEEEDWTDDEEEDFENGKYFKKNHKTKQIRSNWLTAFMFSLGKSNWKRSLRASGKSV